MYTVCVTIRVFPEHIDDYIEAILINARASRREPGNVRFDVLQGVEEKSEFFLYEVYRTEQDYYDHQKTEHYYQYRATVKDWLSEPRKGIHYKSLFPECNIPYWQAD